MKENQPAPADLQPIDRRWPVTDLVAGWTFRAEEVSLGVYVIEGSDIYERSVSKRGVSDPEVALQECAAYARQFAFSSGSVA